MSIKQVERKVIKIINKKKKILARIERGYIQTPETKSKLLQRKIVKGILGGLYKIVYRPKFTGLENLPKDEGYIICSNHVNYLDAAGYVLCSKNKMYVVKPNILATNYPFSKVKKNLDNGSIIALEANNETLKELPAIISYINQKGYNITTLETALSEARVYDK